VQETADIETASDGYAARFAGSVGDYFLDVQLRHTLDLLAPWANGRVLDVGGGHGQLAIPLVARGFDMTVVGSDAVCESRLARSLPPGSYSFRACDLLTLPYDDRSFDAVIAFRLLPHVVRWERLIAEMCRVARHAVVIDYPATHSINFVADRFFGLKKALEGDTRPYRCFTREEIRRSFGAHGFGVARFRPEFTFPMVVHRQFRLGALSRTLEAIPAALGVTDHVGSPVIVRLTRSDPQPA
jgi:SAM-dependent methyltransferase